MCEMGSLCVGLLFQDYVMLILIVCLIILFFYYFVIVVDFTRKIRENCESELIIFDYFCFFLIIVDCF